MAAAVGPAPIQPVGDVQAWLRKLCTSSSGILYEDPFLQVRSWGVCAAGDLRAALCMLCVCALHALLGAVCAALLCHAQAACAVAAAAL
jgi:hypothetical protein